MIGIEAADSDKYHEYAYFCDIAWFKAAMYSPTLIIQTTTKNVQIIESSDNRG